MYKTHSSYRASAEKENNAGRHLLNLWLDGVSINFYLDRVTFTAFEHWEEENEIANRSYAVRKIIALTVAPECDPGKPGLLARLDQWRALHGILARTRAVLWIIRSHVLKKPLAKPTIGRKKTHKKEPRVRQAEPVDAA